MNRNGIELTIHFDGDKELLRDEILNLVEFFKNPNVKKYTIKREENKTESKLKYKK